MFSKPFTSAVAALSLLSTQADAYWRMSCPGTVFTGRVDPIVSPDAISSHVHIVLGGNGFAPNMTYESTQKSTCTSCTIKGDLSNYWTPSLYFRNKTSGFTSVPLAGGQGGTVYYQQRASYKGNNTITAFPKGFRMLAGNPSNRVVDTTNTTQQAVNFACLDYSGKTHYPEGELLPNVTCPDGVRAQVYFPQCWDGVNLDSHDHQSHMAYPSNYNGGDCPDSHPVPTMGLFYEFLYDTGKFEFWTPEGASQPFVFSMGDPTGRGFHGDFISGWDVDILQNGINKKTTQDAGAAGEVTYDGIFEFPDVYGTDCSLPNLVDEPVEGFVEKLPGCNPISTDAVDAHSADCGATTTLAVQSQEVFTDVTSQGWKYLGCGNDTSGANSLPTKVADSPSMTVETCIKQCGAGGYSYAGLEYASQCFCGNSLPPSASPVADSLGDCHMPCKGNAKETCGDASRLSLYQSCKGGDCQNAFVGFIGQVGALGNNTGILGNQTVGSGNSPPSPSYGSTGGSPSSPSASTAALPSASTPASDNNQATGNGPSSGDDSGSSSSAGSPSATSAISLPNISAQPPSSSPSGSYGSSPSPQATPSASGGSGNSSLPAGWSAAGCYTDSLSNRALQGITFAWWGTPITTTNCAGYCASKGFSMAGTEFGEQCFCGDQLQGGAAKTADADCDTPCKADASQTCGGKARLSVVSTKVSKRRASIA